MHAKKNGNTYIFQGASKPQTLFDFNSAFICVHQRFHSKVFQPFNRRYTQMHADKNGKSLFYGSSKFQILL